MLFHNVFPLNAFYSIIISSYFIKINEKQLFSFYLYQHHVNEKCEPKMAMTARTKAVRELTRNRTVSGDVYPALSRQGFYQVGSMLLKSVKTSIEN